MARYFGVPLRNGLPIGLGSSLALGRPSGPPAPIPDDYFEYTTLLLPGNGTNGAQNNTFLDSSTNAFSITRNGNTTQGTFSPFSQTGWSNYFDGAGDYLSIVGNSSSFNLGTSSFTLEAWFYIPNVSGRKYIFGPGTDTASHYDGIGLEIWDNKVAAWASSNGTSWDIYECDTPGNRGSGTVVPNIWNHIAYVRNGNNFAVYLNGVQQISFTSSASIAYQTSNPYNIGRSAYSPDNFPFNGYISNFRLITGTAVYTSNNFTPPTAPLTAITNTSLLTCQSNRFVDNSSNAFAITRNGDVSVQAFSPFNPTAAWSAATNGGSGYFDGSGDYLTVPDNAAFDFGSGDFTISAWVYPQGAGGIIDQGGGGASSNRSFEIYMSSASSISNAYISSDGTYQAGYNLTGTTVPNAWNFIEFTRASGTLRLFVNGVQQSSVSANVTIFNSTATVAIGNTSANAVNPYTGYISDVRVLKGTGSATSTVPTAPLTAIANTQLLCNFTNAGIYDATSKNDLETVGNAQISTTQNKFGGSSMYFDGNGDNLKGLTSPDLNMGTGNWTIECWVYVSSRTLNYPLIFGNNNGGFSAGALAITNSNADSASYNDKFNLAAYDVNSGAPTLTASVTNSVNTWYHLALVRNGTSLVMYRDGVSVASTTISSGVNFNWGKLGYFVGGGNWDGAQSYFNGYIDDLRVTKGVARYTAAFTPPTAAFPVL